MTSYRQITATHCWNRWCWLDNRQLSEPRRWSTRVELRFTVETFAVDHQIFVASIVAIQSPITNHQSWRQREPLYIVPWSFCFGVQENTCISFQNMTYVKLRRKSALPWARSEHRHDLLLEPLWSLDCPGHYTMCISFVLQSNKTENQHGITADNTC